MQNIADIYDEIVKKDKATGNNSANLLLETVAGKNRSNIAASIFQNSTILRSAYESAQDADGTGQEELDKKMDSIEMKINEFRNAVSKLASDWIDTGFVSMVVEGATTVVKFIDAITNAIGGLASTITVLLGLLTGKNLMDKILGTTNSDGSKKDWWWKTLKEFTEGVKGVAQEGFEEVVNTKAVDDNTRSLEANSAAQVRNNAVKGEGALVNATDTVAEDANSASNLENAKTNDIDTASQNKNNISKQAGGTSYIGGKLRSLGGLFGKGGAKIGGLLGIGATGGSLVLGGVITAAVVGITAFVAKQAQAEKQAKAIAEAYKEAEGNIKSATDEMNKAKSVNVEEKAKAFSDLAKGVNLETNANISLTTEQYEEFLSISKEISELYPELTKGYDENGNALVDLSADVDTVTESLKKLKDQQITDAEQEIVNNLDDYVEGYKQNIDNIKKERNAKEYDNDEAKDNIETLKNFEKEYAGIVEKIEKDNGAIAYRINGGDTSGTVYYNFTKLLSELGIEPTSDKTMYSNWTKDTGMLEEESGKEIILNNFNDKLDSIEKNRQSVTEAALETFDNQLKKANEDLNQNLLAWVHQTSSYLNNESLQSVIDQITNNINWENINWQSQSGDTSKEKMQNYIQNRILAPLDKLGKDSEISERLNNIFALNSEEMGLEEYINIIEDFQKELQTKGYTDIKLNFLIDDKKELLKEVEDSLRVNSSQTKIKFKDFGALSKEELDKMKKAQDADFQYLKDYMSEKGINTKEQLEEWKYYTSGIKGADKAIKTYEKGIATAEQGSARVSKIMQDYNMVLDEAIQKVTKDLPDGIDNTDISDRLIEIFANNRNSLSTLMNDEVELGADTIDEIISKIDVTNIAELESCLVELDRLSSYIEPGKLLQYMKSYQVTELAKQIDNLWNSEDFKNKRKDLEKLARTTGITANDVKSLAEENEVLSDVLDTSGMSAEYLANSLNTMCLEGSSAMDTLNSDVMELNRVFDLMTGRIKEADDAYSKWKSSTEQGDYDDQFKNVQEVYKDLEERLKNGDMGKNTRRDVEFLFGKGHGNDTFD